jgi:hypothetical protein
MRQAEAQLSNGQISPDEYHRKIAATDFTVLAAAM